MAKHYSFWYRNGLSLTLLGFMLATFGAQIYFGRQEYNSDMIELGGQVVTRTSYLTTGHFLEATFENRESEFLQMAVFILLTVSLRQQGSAESKALSGQEEVDREPHAHPNAPWAVRKGGIWLSLYKYSLSLAMIVLFLISMALHRYGSRLDYNQQQILMSKATQTMLQYLGNNRFRFESFQNRQSEFLAVFAIVVLSIRLRQQGSAQSKPVDAPHFQTGG